MAAITLNEKYNKIISYKKSGADFVLPRFCFCYSVSKGDTRALIASPLAAIRPKVD